MDYGREFPFDKIKKNETVYIVDYSIEPSEMDKLLEITPNVTWIDHHISAIKKYKNYDKEIRGIRYDGVAGCMLTYCYLKHMTDRGDGDIKPFEESMTEDAPMFTKLIADYDVWTFKYGHLTKEFHERQVMKSLSNEQLIYIIEQLLHSQKLIRDIYSELAKKRMSCDEALFHICMRLYDMPSIDSRTLPAYIDMKLGKITPKEFRCILYGTC